ncbi:hypothetical protein Zmor_008534 [Zophobas morio]|uniref:Uncharacterized protein n=1 Tax=Zophobas morio TaxID=2755281 RepID=A0AA38MQG2_9CUCU|nr:hypothetical protein Zmor_008534 [Zophobas morio]
MHPHGVDPPDGIIRMDIAAGSSHVLPPKEGFGEPILQRALQRDVTQKLRHNTCCFLRGRVFLRLVFLQNSDAGSSFAAISGQFSREWRQERVIVAGIEKCALCCGGNNHRS